jgi:hypothetical protein
MKHRFLNETITYDGRQLRSHWIFEKTELLGDAVVAFCGPANVPLDNMVDLVDVAARQHIYSKSMLHFLIEHFEGDLKAIIYCQRIFCALVAEELNKKFNGHIITREGDDLFEKDKKLSVSIATVSPVSALIHFGINISSCDTPVPTKGLSDYNVDSQEFADLVMKRYVEEISSAKIAQCKVRPVV